VVEHPAEATVAGVLEIGRLAQRLEQAFDDLAGRDVVASAVYAGRTSSGVG
jgi:hypothetical protein